MDLLGCEMMIWFTRVMSLSSSTHPPDNLVFSFLFIFIYLNISVSLIHFIIMKILK